MEQTITEIMNGGLYDVKWDTEHFAWSGCDCCAEITGERLGNSVYEAKGYASLDDAQNHPENYYEFKVCGGCVNAVANGEPWPEED